MRVLQDALLQRVCDKIIGAGEDRVDIIEMGIVLTGSVACCEVCIAPAICVEFLGFSWMSLACSSLHVTNHMLIAFDAITTLTHMLGVHQDQSKSQYTKNHLRDTVRAMQRAEVPLSCRAGVQCSSRCMNDGHGPRCKRFCAPPARFTSYFLL